MIKSIFKNIERCKIVDHTFNLLGNITLIAIVFGTAKSVENIIPKYLMSSVGFILFVAATVSYNNKLSCFFTIYNDSKRFTQITTILIVGIPAGVIIFCLSDFIKLIAESMLQHNNCN